MTDRRRFRWAAYLGILAASWLVCYGVATLLPMPWTLLALPVGGAIGWWGGKRVLVAVNRVEREGP